MLNATELSTLKWLKWSILCLLFLKPRFKNGLKAVAGSRYSLVGGSFSAWTGLSPFSAVARWKKSCRDGGDRAADLGAEGPRGGGGAAHSSKSLAQKGVWAGRGRHPGTAKCVSWTRIQGNCASPHSVCSEANAFLSYCLCRRLVVGTPFISSLGERPRCFESGGGWLDSRGRKEPGGSTSESPGEGSHCRAMPPKGCPQCSQAGCLGCHPVRRERGC